MVSMYPVILHIFVHCGRAQLKQATDLILEILGEESIAKFLTNITEEEIKNLESPENLQLKYIIMCERSRFTPKKVVLPDEDLTVNEKVDSFARIAIKRGASCIFPITLCKSAKSEKSSGYLFGKEEKKQGNQISRKLKKQTMYEEFVKLIYLICGKKADINKFRYPWEVSECSYKEFKASLNKLKNKSEMEIYNRPHFMYVRQPIKPKEVMVVSQIEAEGFDDPSELWNAGVQMVGIFHSYRSKARILNNEFFKQRGGRMCGYALRKEIINVEVATSGKKVASLLAIRLNLLSLNQVPQVTKIKANSTFVLKLELRGVSRDEKHYEYKFTSDGYRYLFPQKEKENEYMCEFKIAYPDDALFYISILLEGAQICQSTFPANIIKDGYRVIPLYTEDYKRYAFSSIFAFINSTTEDNESFIQSK